MDTKVPLRVFTADNIDEVGEPAEASEGYGDAYVAGLPRAVDDSRVSRSQPLRGFDLQGLTKTFGGVRALDGADLASCPAKSTGCSAPTVRESPR